MRAEKDCNGNVRIHSSLSILSSFTHYILYTVYILYTGLLRKNTNVSHISVSYNVSMSDLYSII